MNAATQQSMPFAMTVGAGRKNAQGQYYPVGASVEAVAEALRQQPDGFENWFSLHLWQKNYRNTDNWLASSGIVIDVDYDIEKVPAPDNLQNQLLSLATDGDLPGSIFYLTPRGCRVIWVYDRPCSEREIQQKAEQAAGAKLAAIIPGAYHVDEPLLGELARFFYTPNCTAKDIKRSAEVIVMRQDIADPFLLATQAPAPKPVVSTPPARAPISLDLKSATERWNADHEESYPRDSGECPICGHSGCFGRFPDDDSRWFCWSTSHSSGGIKSARGWHGDALDIEAHRRGVKSVDVLKSDGYLARNTAQREDDAARTGDKRETSAAVKDNDGVQPFACIRIVDVVDTGPPQFLVEGLWLDHGVGIVGGDPKSWKSFFTIYMAIHIAMGKSLFGKHACKQGRVVIFNAEDTASLTRYRVACMCRALEINIADLDLHIIDTPAFFLDDADHVKRLNKTVAAMKPELLILDPLRNLHGLDENDSAILPLVLTPLRLIQREYGCAIQVIHHLVKASEGRTMASRLRGTGALRGWYDSGIVLDRSEDAGPVKATIEHRGAKAADAFTFVLEEATVEGGQALWFDVGAVKKRGEKLSTEEQVIAFKACNPGVSGRQALMSLRQMDISIREADFWKVWNDR